jgi:MFS family permease
LKPCGRDKKLDKALRIRIFSVLFLSIFSALLGLGIILPILPLYAKTIGANGFWIGAIFAGFSLSRSVFMPIVGKVSDKKGIRKAFIVSGLFVYSISSLGYIYSYNVLSLILVRVVHGFCSAMIVPVAMAYIGEISPKNREGTYMGLFTVSLFTGFGFGPLIGGFLQDFYSVNAAFVVMGTLCALSFFLVLFWLPSSHSHHPPQRAAPASFRNILKGRQIKGIICYRFISAFARATVLTFLPLYASYHLNMSGFQIGLVISAGVLLTSIMQYPYGRLADAVSRRNLLLFGNLLYSLTIIFFPFTRSFMQVLGLNLLMGILGAISIPAASALVVAEGKKYGMGSTMAVFNVAMSLGLGTGPIVSGLIHDAAGIKAVFYFSAFVGIAGTFGAARFLSTSPPASPAREHKICGSSPD